MSRYCGDRDIGPIFNAVDIFKQLAFNQGQSAFGFGPIWNGAALDQLVKHYVDNVDGGAGNFLQKLEVQLAGATSDAIVLCAEILWLMLLAPSNIKPSKKRENIGIILGWAGKDLPDIDLLSDQALIGIGSGGTAYNNLRWRELVYAVRLFEQFFKLDETDRVQLLHSGDKFAQWCERIPENESRQFRHMLLYLMYPDTFERIFGSADRVLILKNFSSISKPDIRNLSAFQTDQKLREIRRAQSLSYGTEELDWYVPPLRALWLNTTKSKETTDESIYPTLLKFLEQANTDDLRTKDYPGTHQDLILRISFGAGNHAHVPWIALLASGQTPTRGIYPVYGYYRADNILILTKGVSATNPPTVNWEIDGEIQTVEQYFQLEFNKSAIRYGDSYVHAVYKLSEPLDQEQVDEDLAELIREYRNTLDGVTSENLMNNSSAISEPKTEYHVQAEQEPIALTVDQAMEGVFLGRDRVDDILSLLRAKKNIVLQGPPGVGKSFVAKRLAYALMRAQDKSRVEMIQFHQSYSYEDFVQGYRPGDANFELKNGLFHQFCRKAAKDALRPYVFIIDEINRGNLSKIFGELMLLIEVDKRGEEWQVPLTYSKDLSERFYVPNNVFLIGLMNTADRSLSMVDYALRRRFAFVDLRPEFKSEGFTRHLQAQGAEIGMIATILNKMAVLNENIARDIANLGPGYCIGHSFFCSPPDNGICDDAWFTQIVRFELEPLIREYWFDSPQRAQSIIDELLA